VGSRRELLVVMHGFGGCWTCASGWDRVAPQGCTGAMASGRATWEGWKESKYLAVCSDWWSNHPRGRCLLKVALCKRTTIPCLQTTVTAEEYMHRTLPCWTLVLVLTSLWLMSHGKAAEAGGPEGVLPETRTGGVCGL